MAYQTEVPVESEAAREVLSSIILQRLYTLVGPDGVYEADLDDPDTDLMAAADRAIGLPFGARAEVSDVLDRLDEHLEKITALRSDVHRCPSVTGADRRRARHGMRSPRGIRVPVAGARQPRCGRSNPPDDH